MARHGYGNHYGRWVNVDVCNGGGGNDAAVETYVVCDMGDGSEHWAADDAARVRAGDPGCFFHAFVWGGEDDLLCYRPMPCRYTI